MEERALIAEEKVNEISSKKMNLLKRIEEISGRRALIEFALRSQQYNLLEMGLSALDAEGEPSEMIMRPLEGKVKSLEEEMKLIDGELGALKEEEKSLDEDVEEAKGSHFGILEVLDALQFELDGLLL